MVLEVEKNRIEKKDIVSGGSGFESHRACQETPSLETQAVQTDGIPNESRCKMATPDPFSTCGGRIDLLSFGQPLWPVSCTFLYAWQRIFQEILRP